MTSSSRFRRYYGAKACKLHHDNRIVTATSPRLDPRLRRAAATLDADDAPVAVTWRRVGELAAELGLPRPGYDTIRLVVRRHRRRRAELRELLEPVAADLVQGRFGPWDVERLLEAYDGRWRSA